MDSGGLNRKLVEAWLEAGRDLSVRVSAPAELRDAAGQPFLCEALLPDFGSPTGGVVVSRRTERRVRRQLRGLGGRIWFSIAPDRQSATYVRKYMIEELVDWGWFGPAGEEPGWYLKAGGRPTPPPGP